MEGRAPNRGRGSSKSPSFRGRRPWNPPCRAEHPTVDAEGSPSPPSSSRRFPRLGREHSEADRVRKGGARKREKLSPQGGSGVERTLRRRNPPWRGTRPNRGRGSPNSPHPPKQQKITHCSAPYPQNSRRMWKTHPAALHYSALFPSPAGELSTFSPSAGDSSCSVRAMDMTFAPSIRVMRRTPCVARP